MISSLTEIADNIQPRLSDPIKTALIKANLAVSSLTGIINDIKIYQISADSPEIHCVVTTPASMEHVLGLNPLNFGVGGSKELSIATMKAIGETIERYCSTVSHFDNLIISAYSDLSVPAVHPSRFSLFSSEQYSNLNFRYKEFSEKSNVGWYPTTSLSTGIETLIPTVYLFVPYNCKSEHGEVSIRSPISTGLATAKSVVEALIKSLLEVIERDAFMITWLNRLSMPQIDIKSFKDTEVESTIRLFDRTPAEIKFYWLRMDHSIPTILCVLRGKSENAPSTLVGLASNPSPERAALLALEEAGIGYIWVYENRRQNPSFKGDSRFSNVDDLHKHQLVHAFDSRLINSIDFLGDQQSTVSINDIPAINFSTDDLLLKHLVDDLSKVGMEAFASRLTTADIAELGFEVTRVIIPEAQPLDISHDNQHLGGARLRTVPEKIGISRGIAVGEFNTDPHPFP